MQRWSAKRHVATAGTMRGVLWALFIGVEYYLLSNPIVFVGNFASALSTALDFAVVFLILQAQFLKFSRPAWPLIAFVGYALLTYFWSISTAATFAAAQLYVIVAVLAAISASNVDAATLSHGLAFGGLLALAASIYAAYMSVPNVLVVAGGDGWLAGVGTNTNILGYTLVPALAALLAELPRGRCGWLAWTFTVGALTAGVVLSYSGTAMLAAVTVIVSALTLHSVRWFSRFGERRVRAAIAIPLILVLPTYLVVNAVLLGRDVATLDGRAEVWRAAWESSRPAMVFGNGWGAVWNHPWLPAPANPVLDRVHVRTGIPFVHGHNSFIDPLPELGLVGVALLVGCYLWAGWRAVSAQLSKEASADERARGRIVFFVLIALLVLGVTEPMSVVPLGWFLLVIALTEPKRHRGARQPEGCKPPVGARDRRPRTIGRTASTRTTSDA